MSTQKPIADNLFTWPSDSPKLIGSKDTETGRYFFPAKNSNHHEKVELSNKGKLWTWTVQRFLPKTPYIEQVAPEDFKPYAVGSIVSSISIPISNSFGSIPTNLDSTIISPGNSIYPTA